MGEGDEATVGKPVLNDLASGLATAPVLFAKDEYPQLASLIERKFGSPGDIQEAERLVRQSDGLERTRQLASDHTNRAVDAVMTLAPSPERDALVQLAYKIVSRSR